MLVRQTTVHSSNNSTRKKARSINQNSVKTLPSYLHRISTLTPATAEWPLDFVQSEPPVRDGRKRLP